MRTKMTFLYFIVSILIEIIRERLSRKANPTGNQLVDFCQRANIFLEEALETAVDNDTIAIIPPAGSDEEKIDVESPPADVNNVTEAVETFHTIEEPAGKTSYSKSISLSAE